MRSTWFAVALFTAVGTLYPHLTLAQVTYQGQWCWEPACLAPCPDGYERANEWSPVCERINEADFNYYGYPLLNPMCYEGQVFQHHVMNGTELAPGEYTVTYSVDYPVWVNPSQQPWNTVRQVSDRESIRHDLQENGDYGVVGLAEYSVQHIPSQTITCDDWMWDGCPEQFTVWYKIEVYDDTNALLYDAMYPQGFEATPIQP